MKNRYDMNSAFNAELHAKTYDHYCEAIMYPDGRIEYAIPSHSEKLHEATLNVIKDKKLYEEKMNNAWNDTLGCQEWELEVTGCILMWYENFFAPSKVTQEQLDALGKLYDLGVVSYSPIDVLTRSGQEQNRQKLISEFILDSLLKDCLWTTKGKYQL